MSEQTIRDIGQNWNIRTQPAPSEIETKMKELGGWWSDRFNGLMIFPNLNAATEFEVWFAMHEVPKSRAPTNLQALDMIENAVRSAKHAKLAKTYLDGSRTNAINHSTIKVNWGSDGEHAAAFFYIDQAFKEYLPAIFDVARKKAEEADRAARDQLRHWGEKS